MNSCTNVNGEEDLIQKTNLENNNLNSSNKSYNLEVENLAKKIVIASSKIMLDDYIIETNE